MEGRAWPLGRLRISTPLLHLRVPSDAMLDCLAQLAVQAPKDSDYLPFGRPRRDEPDDLIRLDIMQDVWRQRASWQPDNWTLQLVAVRDGRLVGTQSLFARDFAIVRAVGTSSWVPPRCRGQGVGKEMRAAILHLAFAELGALSAGTGAFEGNLASLAVSRALGYQPNGINWEAWRGLRTRALRFLLEREQWSDQRRPDITVRGIQACRALFGL